MKQRFFYRIIYGSGIWDWTIEPTRKDMFAVVSSCMTDGNESAIIVQKVKEEDLTDPERQVLIDACILPAATIDN